MGLGATVALGGSTEMEGGATGVRAPVNGGTPGGRRRAASAEGTLTGRARCRVTIRPLGAA